MCIYKLVIECCVAGFISVYINIYRNIFILQLVKKIMTCVFLVVNELCVAKSV